MKKTFFRVLVLLTVLAMLLGTAACGKRGKTLLSLDKDGISVTFTLNEYQLMLGRTKATLDAIQNANDNDFWNTWIGSPAITMDQHYTPRVTLLMTLALPAPTLLAHGHAAVPLQRKTLRKETSKCWSQVQ